MMAVITSAAGAGPSMHASNAPPTRWPLVPMPTGKLIIWAANTKAPITPSSGMRVSSNSRPARRARSATAGMLIASSAAHTGVDRKLSGIYISADALTVSRLFKACHTLTCGSWGTRADHGGRPPILALLPGDTDDLRIGRAAARPHGLWRCAPLQGGDSLDAGCDGA